MNVETFDLQLIKVGATSQGICDHMHEVSTLSVARDTYERMMAEVAISSSIRFFFYSKYF